MKESTGSTGVAEPFSCPELPGLSLPDWQAWGGGGPSIESEAAVDSDPHPPDSAALEQRLEEEKRRSFEAGRRQGFEEGVSAERAAQGSVHDHLAVQLERLSSAFDRDRDRYLQAVEGEVVRLALAVAARILRREAQMDPLLLTGAVRVLLGQVAASTHVRLRVPAAELELWKQAISLLPGSTTRPEVLAGEGMRLGDCLVETELGSADLGVRAQLSEIERGFFDRSPEEQSSELALTASESRP